MRTVLRRAVPVLLALVLMAPAGAIPSLRIVDRTNQEVTIAGFSFTGDPVTLAEDEVMTVKSPFSKVVPALLDGSSSPPLAVLRAPGQPELQGTVQAPKTATVSGIVVSPGMGGLSYEIPLTEIARWDLADCALAAPPDASSHTWTYRSGSLTDIRDRQWVIASGLAFTLGSSSGIPTLRLLWGKGTLRIPAGLARWLAVANGQMQVTLGNGLVVTGTAPTDWDGAMGQGEAGEVKLKAAGVKAAQWVYLAAEGLNQGAGISGVAFSPDGATLATVSSGNSEVRLWEVATGNRKGTLANETASAVAFSADGTLLATGGTGGNVKVWEVATGTLKSTLTGGGSELAVAFSPDGRQVAAGSSDRNVRLWDLATGTLTKTLSGHSDYVRGVAYSPDGTLLASASDDQSVRLWKVADGSLVGSLTGHPGWTMAVAFSADGRQIVSGSKGGGLKVWDTASRNCVATLKGQIGDVYAVAFSPDGATIASGSGDNNVRLWDAATGECLATLKGHSASVASVAFSPDGRLLASGAGDSAAFLWDVATRQQVDFHVVESILNAAGAPPAAPAP